MKVTFLSGRKWLFCLPGHSSAMKLLASWLVGRTVGPHCRRGHSHKQYSQASHSQASDPGPTRSLAQPDHQPVGQRCLGLSMRICLRSLLTHSCVEFAPSLLGNIQRLSHKPMILPESACQLDDEELRMRFPRATVSHTIGRFLGQLMKNLPNSSTVGPWH